MQLHTKSSRFTIRSLTGYFFIAPALIFLATVAIYPILYNFLLSFSDYSPIEGKSYFVGLKHYSTMLSDGWFYASLKNSLVFTVGSVVLHFIIALFLAILANHSWRSNRLRDIFRGLWILPWIFSTAAAALMWALLFHPSSILNYHLQQIGLISRPVNYLGEPSTALWVLISVNVWKTYPIYMVLILAGLQSIPGEVKEAAIIDGANFLERLWYITLPLMRSVLLTAVSLDFITTLGHFDLAKIMTEGGPLRSTELLGYYIYRTAFKGANFSYGATLSIVMFFILGVYTLIYINLYFKET